MAREAGTDSTLVRLRFTENLCLRPGWGMMYITKTGSMDRYQMRKQDDKISRLVNIARLYYEEDKTQSEIASRYQISRPMVSKLLEEARKLGIVTIRIKNPAEGSGDQEALVEQVRRTFGVYGGVAVADGASDSATNAAVSQTALCYLESLEEDSLGLGWGHIIGDLVAYVERENRTLKVGSRVCPLIGNGGVGLKNYHSNELVRVIAEHSQAKPEFLYSPACMSSEQELSLIRELDNYRTVYNDWERLDVALVNIGNFPSVPDFATEARFGDLLVRRKAVGRILNYFVDVEGRVIHSDMDFAVQIPLELLGRVRHVVGICSANTKGRALRGALRTGYINHVIAPEHVMQAAMEV